MSDDETHAHCRQGISLSIGLGVGILVGIAVGSMVVSRLGRQTVNGVRGLFGRMAGRTNRVNFELLLQ